MKISVDNGFCIIELEEVEINLCADTSVYEAVQLANLIKKRCIQIPHKVSEFVLGKVEDEQFQKPLSLSREEFVKELGKPVVILEEEGGTLCYLENPLATEGVLCIEFEGLLERFTKVRFQ